MSEHDNCIHIDIGIPGGRVEHYEYLPYHTEAPTSYDGFGTTTIAALSGARIVLIHPDHVSWQLTRYASGSYATRQATPNEVSCCIDRLTRRVRGIRNA